MNEFAMISYVEFVADCLSVALGKPKIFNTENPFEWMESIALQGKTNFFEARVTEYARSGINVKIEDKAQTETFSLDEEF